METYGDISRISRKFLTLALLIDVRKIRTRLRWNHESAGFQLQTVQIHVRIFLSHTFLFMIFIPRSRSLSSRRQFTAFTLDFHWKSALVCSFRYAFFMGWRHILAEAIKIIDCRPVFGGSTSELNQTSLPPTHIYLSSPWRATNWSRSSRGAAFLGLLALLLHHWKLLAMTIPESHGVTHDLATDFIRLPHELI